MTKNYIKIDPQYYELLKYGTHVRYIGVDGKFRVGGFITKNPIIYEDKKLIKLQNNFNKSTKGYHEWSVSYDSIDVLFAKPDAVTMSMYKDLEDAVKLIRNQVKQLTKIIKESHN
uniref:C129R homolog protein n=1 Tax=Abalone asfa-like virus TaxID=2839893 RepID=A0A5K7XYI3_9VIRU|nr:C129R homolog protein [Abalone asfa-like virus]